MFRNTVKTKYKVKEQLFNLDHDWFSSNSIFILSKTIKIATAFFIDFISE